MTGRILNPVQWEDLEPGLTEAEKQFAECVARENPCVLGNVVPKAEESVPHNTIRSEVIRFFVHGGDGDNPVRGTSITLMGAWITGENFLDLMCAKTPYALVFSKCHFDIPVLMHNADCAELNLSGSHMAHGLVADGLMTRSDVKLREGFCAKDEVRLVGAKIGANLDCEGGKFRNPKEDVLSLDRVTVKGDVNLRKGFFEGEVRLLNASIGGDLRCTDGKFSNPKQCAFSADGATVTGNVYMGRGFSATGEVRLSGANIGGDLSCEGGKFHNPKSLALDAERISINGGLLWWKMSGGGNIYLGHAKVDILADGFGSWEPFKVILDGLTYNRFANHADVKSRIKWLESRPAEIPFSPQPYEQAAKALFGMGYSNDAREILLKKERLQTEDERTPWHHKIGRRLWDVLAGYGYRLRYTAAWMAFFFLFGAAVFDCADYYGNIVPTHPVVALSDGYMEKIVDSRPTQAVPPEYPAFNSVMFSLDVFTPSAVFHQENFWGPRSGGGDWLSLDFDILWLLTLWYWFQVAAGWVLVPLFLLSITGILRPRQSSGERD